MCNSQISMERKQSEQRQLNYYKRQKERGAGKDAKMEELENTQYDKENNHYILEIQII